jgi:hypothetical protein
MTAREIAAQLAARYPIGASNSDAMKALVAKVRNALARQKGLMSEVRGDAKAWRVAPLDSLAERSHRSVGNDDSLPHTLR